MKEQDFTTTMIFEQSPKEVFNAIKNPRDWWSGEITGSAANLNDEFTYRYADLHMSKQKIVEMVPDQKIVWLVTDSIINYVEDKNEWTGTKIKFEIARQGNKTELRFTHVGLHTEIECFDSCSSSWTQLLRAGLVTLITTGKVKKIVLA